MTPDRAPYMGSWQLELLSRAHYGAEHVSLIGFSYLGLMTAIYASRHPDRVERLAQLGPAPAKPARLTPRAYSWR